MLTFGSKTRVQLHFHLSIYNKVKGCFPIYAANGHVNVMPQLILGDVLFYIPANVSQRSQVLEQKTLCQVSKLLLI